MADLVIKETKRGKTLTLEMCGDIDETSDFTKVPLNDVTEIIVDADDVKGINSWGVKEWTKWARSLPNTIKFTLTKCPQVIINQINLIAGFLPKGAVVASFYVPYYCNNCGHASSILFSTDEKTSKDSLIGGKAAVCEKCSSQAEWDVITKTYFKFMDSENK